MMRLCSNYDLLQFLNNEAVPFTVLHRESEVTLQGQDGLPNKSRDGCPGPGISFFRGQFLPGL